MEVINQTEILSYISDFPAEAESLTACLLMLKRASWLSADDIAHTFANRRIDRNLVIIKAGLAELLLFVDYANERIIVIELTRAK